ncbi:MAG: hypothetical protein WDM84_08555 [Bauldia sp.]
MTAAEIKAVLDRVLSWPPERQDEAAELLLALEGSEGELYHPSEEEWAAVLIGLGEAERGEFATEEEMEELWRNWTK